jgi:hypothetical protein
MKLVAPWESSSHRPGDVGKTLRRDSAFGEDEACGPLASSRVDVPALHAYIACMKASQHTIRGVPRALDDRVREEARQYGTSVNAALLAALSRGLGAQDEPVEHHDMDDLAGTWVEDEAFHDAVAAFRSVDRKLWR